MVFIGKKGVFNGGGAGFTIELIGAALVSFGVLTIPFRLFGNELISEFIVAIGTLIMIVGRFLR